MILLEKTGVLITKGLCARMCTSLVNSKNPPPPLPVAPLPLPENVCVMRATGQLPVAAVAAVSAADHAGMAKVK